ncbi:MAG: hypothetical protein WEB30_05735 [Cyclobacteriaceae bacterium]
MAYNTNNDNIYTLGTVIAAKSKPDVKLIIRKYYHRTYYCDVMDDLTQKPMEYFEKELIPPSLHKTVQGKKSLI